jgi:hypothetical protein
MRKIFLLAAAVVFCLGSVGVSGYRARSGNALARAVAPAQNPELDFTIVNKTGYDIKALYIGASGTGDWAKEDDVLKGKGFPNGKSLPVQFQPKEKHEKWDIMVSWADGSGNVEWLNLKLTEIDKVTLVYDKEKDKTSAIIE